MRIGNLCHRQAAWQEALSFPVQISPSPLDSGDKGIGLGLGRIHPQFAQHVTGLIWRSGTGKTQCRRMNLNGRCR